ncbi:hypothetical protein JYQ62_22055 [Nostoc sp. UHCC 0702]|nr:hypothetical protein JYQ62_22055 [Nostoc sp. UHCC 0702]
MNLEINEKLLTPRFFELILQISKLYQLEFCQFYLERKNSDIVLVVDCPKYFVDNIWENRHKILSAASKLGLKKKLIIKKQGEIFGVASSPLSVNEIKEKLMFSTAFDKFTYNDLLIKVANSQYPTFVTEVPKGWHWGQPQNLILTNSQVAPFSGVKPVKLHGQDVTLLYDQHVFEKQMSVLTKDFEITNQGYNFVEDYSYISYTIDKSRQSLCRDIAHEYNADFELIYLRDMETVVRVCYCKERRPL